MPLSNQRSASPIIRPAQSPLTSIQRPQKHGQSHPPRTWRQRSKAPPPPPRLSLWVNIPLSRPPSLLATSSAPPSVISPSHLLHPLSPSNSILNNDCQLGFVYCVHTYCCPILPPAKPQSSSYSTTKISHAPQLLTAPSPPLSSPPLLHQPQPSPPDSEMPCTSELPSLPSTASESSLCASPLTTSPLTLASSPGASLPASPPPLVHDHQQNLLRRKRTQRVIFPPYPLLCMTTIYHLPYHAPLPTI